MPAGRPPKGEYAHKTGNFSTRIRADTRAALEAAAQASGRTLSQEAEHRLRRSFDEDEALIDRLGGRQLYAMFRMIAAAMEMAAFRVDKFRTDGQPYNWLADPYGYDQAMKAAIAVMERLRPHGEPALPTTLLPPGLSQELWDAFVENRGATMARYVTNAVAGATPGQPLDDDIMARIADALGPMRDNLPKKDQDDE